MHYLLLLLFIPLIAVAHSHPLAAFAAGLHAHAHAQADYSLPPACLPTAAQAFTTMRTLIQTSDSSSVFTSIPELALSIASSCALDSPARLVYHRCVMESQCGVSQII